MKIFSVFFRDFYIVFILIVFKYNNINFFKDEDI